MEPVPSASLPVRLPPAILTEPPMFIMPPPSNRAVLFAIEVSSNVTSHREVDTAAVVRLVAGDGAAGDRDRAATGIVNRTAAAGARELPEITAPLIWRLPAEIVNAAACVGRIVFDDSSALDRERPRTEMPPPMVAEPCAIVSSLRYAVTPPGDRQYFRRAVAADREFGRAIAANRFRRARVGEIKCPERQGDCLRGREDVCRVEADGVGRGDW